jgi:putative endonuclease
MAGYYLYIVRCKDQSLYIGITNNLEKRFRRHQIGYGAQYTKIHTPEQIVYNEFYPSYQEARSREVQIKKWRRDKKERLIKGLKP